MIQREAEKTIKEVGKTFKVLLLTGPRQVGKTTLLRSLMPKNMTYISLDDVTLRRQASEDPKMFLLEHPAPLFIDEVQYAPELFSYIKIAVDSSDKRGQYWLTGSQQFHLMKNVSESLAGRVGIIELNSFTYAEKVKNTAHKPFNPEKITKMPPLDVNQVFRNIFQGGMPEICTTGVRRDLYFQGYINTYIERDVRSLTQIGNEMAFRKFLVSVATRTGEQLNYTSLANDAGISVNTAKSWLSILVASGLVYLLAPFGSSELKRLTRMPKIVFMDTGLAAYLAGWESASALQSDSAAGHYLETFIVSEIVKSYGARGVRPRISYFRNKDKQEIDLIFAQNNILYPFEIKKTASPNELMLKDLRKLVSLHKTINSGGIICFFEEQITLPNGSKVIPIGNVIG